MGRKCVIFLALLVSIWFTWPVSGEMKDILSKSPALRVNPDFGKYPLYFIANKGQVNEKARFYARASRYTLWLTPEGLVFDSTRKTESGERFERDVSRMQFVGANKNPGIMPGKEAKARVNFYIGNDPSKWQGNVPTSLAVSYKNIYKNIDLKVYGIEKQIEYDWIVKPGGNPEAIGFEYRNVKGILIDEQGNLLVETDFGQLMHRKPICYQDIDNQRRTVKAEFKKVGKNLYGFSVGEYNKDYNLIIDPVVLAYSTYLGGTGVDSNWSMDIDNNGNVYVTGYTSSTNFPIINQYQSEPGDSNTDVFVSKIDTTKSGLDSLVYSTYLGGSSIDEGLCIAVDVSGIAYVTGYTNSSDFPIKNQYQSDQAGEDVFVVKLDTYQNGAASFLYSTYVGGNEDEKGKGIAVDSSGFIYLTGVTSSSNFPTKNQYQLNPGGLLDPSDVFVTKLDTSQSGNACLIYSTYLGGGDAIGYNIGEEGNSIAVDNSGNAYVTGFTTCSDFPIKNQYQSHPSLLSEKDTFITRIDTTQSGADSLIYSTYLGGSGNEEGYDVEVGNSGNAYVTGYTNSTNFPQKNQYQSAQGGYDAFITRIDTNQGGTASLIYSTYLGGGGGDEGLEIAIDNSNYVYVTGYTASSNFPILDYYQSDQPDRDAFVIKLDTAQSGNESLIYSTYLGGNGRDSGKGIAVDVNGNIYVSGLTASSNFPVLNQYQTNPDSTDDIFITKLIPPQIEIAVPNGGESFEGGSIQNIIWSSIGVNGDVKIEYSIDNGSIWLEVVSSTENDGSYSWTVPGTISNLCLVRISETDGSPSIKSANVFSIIPSIKINFPNGGQSFEGGSIQNITWSSAGVNGNVRIEYSTNEGSNWTEIIASAPNSGSYTWVIPTIVSNFCLVRVSETDGSPNGASNAVFSIIPPHGTITVTSPTGGENLEVNSTHNITWTTTGSIGLINIDYSLDKGANWTSIVYSSTFEGSYYWHVPNSLSSNCLIRVSETNSFIYDTNNTVFSIVPVASITLLSPTGQEQWQVGSLQDITWSTTGVIANVKIDYSYFDGTSQTDWITIASSTQNDGAYQWTIPNTPANGCFLRVSDLDGAPVGSNGMTFSIIPAPEIKVTYPNGNESLEVESQHNITWNSIGAVGNFVSIEYSTNNGLTWKSINSLAANTGSYSWTVPKVVANQCLIRIGDSDGSPVDTSDSSFVIYSTSPIINVTFPNGGETLTGLSLQDITWESYNLYGYVKIEYSSDGGSHWDLIATNVIDVGGYPWSVPNGPQSLCLVKVSSVDGTITDSSDGTFAISQVPTRIPEIERRALINLYNGTNGDSWTNKSGWKTPPLHTDGFAMPGTEGSWYGVTVIGNAYVEGIRLRNNNLSGPIAYSIGDFSHIVEIDFYSNKLNGNIPTSIGKLSSLQILSLHNNQITGLIPDTIGNLQSIVILNLYQNQLYGPLPSTIGNLANLSTLMLSDNQLSGNIPPEIGNLGNLTNLNLGKNFINGNIPTTIGNLSQLRYLQLYQNLLDGSIPVSTGNLTNLNYIDFGSNSLSGNIPAELGNLANLSDLALNDNRLEGTIPTSFGNLTGLSSLILDKNKLSGLIPTELGNLTNLRTLKLQSNKLVGNIPISLSNLTKLGNLWTDIGYNGLYTNDNTLRTFLSGKDPDWETTQTIAPVNVAVSPLSSSSVQVSWTPTTYTADTGGYQVYYSTTPGGPYTLFDTTANKTASSMIVNGLTPAAPYYFVVRTRTLAHTNNQNILESEYSAEVPINTPPVETIEVTYPDGGENLDVGSIQNISWSFTGIVGNLKIEYSINNGSNWIEIVSSTENDGSFSWTIPGTPSNQCRVRISEIDGSPANASDAVFSIVYSPSISGWIKSSGIGLANVVMNGLPGNPMTNAAGFYTSAVNYGWSGVVTPTLAGYTFTEPSTTYANVTSDQLTDYNATLLTYTISGAVTHGGIGLVNVAMIGLPGNPLTDTSGFYTATVNYGWSGTAVPTLTNYNFTPPSTNYTGIAANQTTNYTTDLANQIPASERQALIDFYNSTNGDSWANNSGWKTAPLNTDGFAMPGTEESWFGISVESNNHVSSITLGSNGLVGTIPISIGNLSYLTEIQLYTNQLAGAIPTSIGLLQYLEIFDMGNNQLSGIIPTEIGNLGNLRFLYLYSNQLTGSIPPAIGNCTNLIRLYLDDNQLSGKIPQEVCNLTNLERFDFSANNIIGKIPNCITNLTSLADSFTDIDYNGLYAQDESTRSFLNSKAPGWEKTQTVAPTGVTAAPATSSSIQVNWTPIIYTSDNGFYEVYFSTSPGGPYTLFGATANKSTSFMRVTNLTPNTTYYFIVRTITEAHGYNQNRVESDDSNEINAATFPITPVLTLTSPNGGETWKAGSSQLVTWTGLESSGNIKVEYSTDNAVTWNDVTLSTPNDGIYNWTVPNTSSNECRVRISQTDEDIIQSDISDGMFSIMAPSGPTITVISPNGKEKLAVGTVHEINWTDTGISGDVKIEYSINKGQSWEIIETSLDNNGSFNWTVPDTPSSTCLVRVGEVDSAPYDISDNVFSIITKPTITLTSPNGGESWQAESDQSITWTTVGIRGDVKLEYSIDNGAYWELITANTPNDGIYNWIIPNTVSNGCLVRISLFDPDEDIFDVSDAEFSITPAGTLTLLYPNNKEELKAGGNSLIEWISEPGVGTVKLEYSIDKGTNYYPLQNNLANTGSWHWSVPFENSANCLVRLSQASGESGGQNDLIYEMRFKVFGPRSGINGGAVLVLWLGDYSDETLRPFLPKISILRSTAGEDFVCINGAKTQIEPLSTQWRHLKVLLSRKVKSVSIWLDEEQVFKDIPIGPGYVFTPAISFSAGKAGCMAVGIDDLLVKIYDPTEGMKKFTGLFCEDFEDFQEKDFPVDGGWTKSFPGEGTDDPGSIFISRDSLRTGKFLKLKAPQPGINIAVKKFSLPGSFPFDVSDHSFKIVND